MSEHKSKHTTPILEENEKILEKNYTIIINKQLGKGGFGQIYLGRNIKENIPIAIKVEEKGNRSHLLLEYQILEEIQGDEGIPKVYKFREGHKHNYLLMELLGKSIDKLFSECNKFFSNRTIYQIGYQMIKRIVYVHSKGYIHRDIKPGNFVIGRKDKKKTIYIIDFGLSKRYIDKDTNKHIPYKEGKGLTGTARYVSLFTHYGIEQSRRDDIEGIAYNLIYLAKGKLPWQGVKTKNKKEKHKKIMDMKILYTPEKLCKDLPNEFANLLNYARELEFEEEPNYKSIKNMFKNEIKKSGDSVIWEFDWEKPKIDKEKEKEENEKIYEKINELFP
jgi:serine/threonine protein kinase